MFKDIKNYEGLYKVNEIGEVKSLEKKRRHITYKERILKPIKDNYLKVSLFKNGKGKRVSIHRLVAKTFLKNKNSYPQVNHKDGDKFNNNVKNLEFCTAKQNMKHAFNTGLMANVTKKDKKVKKRLDKPYNI